MDGKDEQLLASYGRSGDVAALLELAVRLEAEGDLSAAATAYDRAFGLSPGDPAISGKRQVLLDQLEVFEHGIRFRFVPGGTFLMGSNAGEPDEAPVHAVTFGEFWLSETPVTWSMYCDLMDWSPPPEGIPRVVAEKKASEGFDSTVSCCLRPTSFGCNTVRRKRLKHATGTHTPLTKRGREREGSSRRRHFLGRRRATTRGSRGVTIKSR